MFYCSTEKGWLWTFQNRVWVEIDKSEIAEKIIFLSKIITFSSKLPMNVEATWNRFSFTV